MHLSFNNSIIQLDLKGSFIKLEQQDTYIFTWIFNELFCLLIFLSFILLQNAMWASLVLSVTFLVATLAMAAIIKVNATVLKFTVIQLLDVKVIQVII